MKRKGIIPLLFFSVLVSAFAFQNNVPGIIDGKVSPKVSNVPNSGYDTTFVAKWELELSDSVNFEQVHLQVQELGSKTYQLNDTVGLSSLNGSEGPPPYRDGLRLYFKRGTLQMGKRYRYEAELIGSSGEVSPKSFKTVR